MSFYQSLQLDPFILKQRIKDSCSKKEKYFFSSALLVRDILLILFALFFIQGNMAIFGNENSGYGVVLFCMLLSLRFVDFGYQASQAVIGMGIVFFLLFSAPLINGLGSPILKLLLNFASLCMIFFLTSSKPKFGNAGLYSFSYLFLVGSAQTMDSQVIKSRGWLLFFNYCFFGLLYYLKHRQKHQTFSFKQMVLTDGVLGKRNLWLINYALGVSLLLFIGDFLPFQRFMWIGFAFSSILGSFGIVGIRQRCKDRLIGAIAGSLCFLLLAQLPLPFGLSSFGIFGGLALGICSSYRYKTVFNCFGALSIAVALFGLKEAVLIRMIDSLLGVVFAAGYIFITKKIFYNEKSFDFF